MTVGPLQRLRARLGDFWWYSLLVFAASRVADAINAFVGLWLVPKYVDPAELGAVAPLTSFAAYLAFPAMAFASAFRGELTRLAVGREFGKLKTLMRGVFAAVAVALVLAVVAAKFALPLLLERIRIVEGSLGILIIAASFVGAVAPVYTSAMQALKKFGEFSVICFVTAPVRFAAMLVAMPFRSLSGYFVGQASAPAFQIAASVFCLRKELAVPAEPYWSRPLAKRFAAVFLAFLAFGAAGGIPGLVEATVIRQRMCDLDSAGYYMATRISEIATFLYGTLAFTIFPYSAAAAAKGEDTRPIFLKSLAATTAFSALVAAAAALVARPVLTILPHGAEYAAYWWTVPCLIGISSMNAVVGMYTTVEVSAWRFSFLKWMIPLDLAYPALLLLVTGYGYFRGVAPDSWMAFLEAHNVRSLGPMLCWMGAIAAIKATACLVAAMKGGARK